MSVGGRFGDREDDGRPNEETQDENETLGEALSKAGFEPARAERKIVSQGKRREALKKRVPKGRGT